MKALMLALLITTLTAAQAGAGGLGIFASYWDPKDADDEIGFGAKLRFRAAPEFALELRGSYFEFEERDATTRKTLEVIPIEGALLYNLGQGQPTQFYVGGGIGYYLLDLEWEGPTGTVRPSIDDEIGWFVVGGLEVGMSPNISLFIEAKYTWLDIDEIGGMETAQDDTLDGFGANAGLILLW